MATPLSAENRVREFLSRHSLDGIRFVQIVGPALSQTRLSQALSDVRPFDREQAEAALRTVVAIERLLELCDPIPVSLRNPATIKKLLTAMEDGTLTIDVAIEERVWQQISE